MKKILVSACLQGLGQTEIEGQRSVGDGVSATLLIGQGIVVFSDEDPGWEDVLRTMDWVPPDPPKD